MEFSESVMQWAQIPQRRNLLDASYLPEPRPAASAPFPRYSASTPAAEPAAQDVNPGFRTTRASTRGDTR
jgi:hypothetical protein